MPSQDLNFSYGDVKSKINAAKTYNQVRQDIAQLSKKKGDNEEVNSKKLAVPALEATSSC